MKKKQFSIEMGGKTLTAEFNDFAERANGSTFIKYGNTIILATAVMSKQQKDTDFFPLTVDYEEKFYASGQILGSRFVRREGKPSDQAILSGRIVDRTIRPLFDQHIRNEVQVIITVLSIDEDDPAIIAVIGASLALATSNIPWDGPVSAVRVAKLKNQSQFIINPSFKWREQTDLEFEMVLCAKDNKVNMIEFQGKEPREDVVVQAMKAALNEISRIETFQKEIVESLKPVKKELVIKKTSKLLIDLFSSHIKPKLLETIFNGTAGDSANSELSDIWLQLVDSQLPDEKNQALELFEQEVNELIHTQAIEHNKRADNRTLDEIRPLFAQAGGISPVLHGSGIFYRGGTHILTSLTLGGPKDAQIIDGLEEEEHKRFMHHYNFPPFSTGETGRVGGTNRRMIGHGALAEKALEPVLPSKEIFPYTIRLVSEALSSNGSTSMGSVCASTLALMDGGVPITKPVAGIASGLMMRNDNEYKLLTDIQGPEDHYGDMDFKVAGTRDGITAIQMDVKVAGIPLKILEQALEKAKIARYKILDVIESTISEPRKNISIKAPKIITFKIKPEQIGLVIGPGGKTINGIIQKTGAEGIDIEEDGLVYITGKNGTADKALEFVYQLTREYKVGEKFQGEVTRLMDFGAFVKIGPNTEGLVHISEIASFRVEKIQNYLKEGDIVPVVIKLIDDKKRINLSIKDADPQFIKIKK